MGMRDKIKQTLVDTQGNMERKLHNLNYLFVEITTACNLNCLHCGSDCKKAEKPEHLPPNTVLKVLAEIKSRYNSREITVALSGGEPLCYPDVFKLGREITRLEFPWGMVTNGYAWSGETVRDALSAGLHSITVSLDGLSDEHDWLRGQEGAFARAIETIAMLRRYPDWKAMDVVTCVNQRNLPSLDRIYLLLKALGVRDWRLFTISPISRAVDEAELFLSRDQFGQLIEKIKSFRSRNEMSVNYSESGYLGHRVENEVRDHPYFCRAGINVAGIMANGDILACPNIDRRFRQGNVLKDSFVDVWENKYRKFRNRKWMKVGECAVCPEWDHCQGNSFHLWDADNKKTRMCYCHEYGLLDE